MPDYPTKPPNGQAMKSPFRSKPLAIASMVRDVRWARPQQLTRR
jgi:hypothetical protein